MGTRKPEEGRQRGFFVSDDGCEMRLRPQTGDAMVRPKETKHPKSRTTTIFAEVVAFEAALRDRDDRVGMHRYENVNGAVDVVEAGRHTITESISGEPGAVLYRHDEPVQSSLHELSAAARRLFWRRQKEANEKLVK